jgi:hypothetical protein
MVLILLQYKLFSWNQRFCRFNSNVPGLVRLREQSSFSFKWLKKKSRRKGEKCYRTTPRFSMESHLGKEGNRTLKNLQKNCANFLD